MKSNFIRILAAVFILSTTMCTRVSNKDAPPKSESEENVVAENLPEFPFVSPEYTKEQKDMLEG